jgi:phosphopantothenoylcysteine decarboxylase / phosphopantothenate---cysteine ligase
VVVTAGPTRESIDPVRVVTNRSSGKMGYRVAEAAWERGADVVLVSGPVALPAPVGVRVRRVESTMELEDAVREELPKTDVLVMAAAPADYQPAERAPGKLKKTGTPRALELRETPDILVSTRQARRKGAVVVGFALETDDLLANARRKLDGKGLDMVVLNAANEPGAGFAVDTNRVTIVTRAAADPEQLPLLDKRDVADAILDRVEVLLNGR